MSPDDDQLSERIRRDATRHHAPDALRASLRAQIALAEAGRPAASRPPRCWPWTFWRSARWPTGLAGFALGLAFALLVLPRLPGLDEPLEATLVADHVRALRVGPLTEVVSTDRHTVKPWFQGRIDYAPPVFDLGADGFPLQGGRIEHLRGSSVATLTYLRNRHVIDLYVWPSDAQAAPAAAVQRGFNLLHWADGSMQYWAVSDVERAELERFAQGWQARAAAR